MEVHKLNIVFYTQDECSFVSLRDVERVLTVMAWFYNQSQENGELFEEMDNKPYGNDLAESSDEEDSDDDDEDEFPTFKMRTQVREITHTHICSTTNPWQLLCYI